MASDDNKQNYHEYEMQADPTMRLSQEVWDSARRWGERRGMANYAIGAAMVLGTTFELANACEGDEAKVRDLMNKNLDNAMIVYRQKVAETKGGSEEQQPDRTIHDEAHPVPDAGTQAHFRRTCDYIEDARQYLEGEIAERDLMVEDMIHTALRIGITYAVGLKGRERAMEIVTDVFQSVEQRMAERRAGEESQQEGGDDGTSAD